MTNKEKNQDKEKKLDNMSDQEVVNEVLKTPLIAEAVDKKIEEKAKETGKRLFLQQTVKDFDEEKLSNNLTNYKNIHKKGFSELIGEREKIIKNIDEHSIEDLENFKNKIDIAIGSESEFINYQRESEKRNSEKMPTRTSSSEDDVPESLDTIDKNIEKYQHLRYKGFSKLYKTKVNHKEFDKHEKNDLCSIHNDNCHEATVTWQNELALAERAHRKYIQSIYVLN